MTGIHSKAATKEYRDNHSRIFGLTPMERKWLEEEEKAASAAEENRCECAEAVCHVPDEASPEYCLKSLMAGVDVPETIE